MQQNAASHREFSRQQRERGMEEEDDDESDGGTNLSSEGVEVWSRSRRDRGRMPGHARVVVCVSCFTHTGAPIIA